VPFARLDCLRFTYNAAGNLTSDAGGAYVPTVVFGGMYATQGRYKVRVLKHYYGLNHLHYLTTRTHRRAGTCVIVETRAVPGAAIPAQAGIYCASHWKCAGGGLDSRLRGNDQRFERDRIPIDASMPIPLC